MHRGVGKENCKEGKGLCIRYLEIEAEENESEKTFSRIKGIPCKEDLERWKFVPALSRKESIGKGGREKGNRMSVDKKEMKNC